MGVRILTSDNGDNYQVMYCSTTMSAFGPIMYGDAEEFIESLPQDPRSYNEPNLDSAYSAFMVKKEEANGD